MKITKYGFLTINQNGEVAYTALGFDTYEAAELYRSSMNGFIRHCPLGAHHTEIKSITWDFDE